jgi:hypothetical protein
MRSYFILLVTLLLVTFNCFSQVAVQKQLNQKQMSARPKTELINPSLKRDTLVQASSKTQTTTTPKPPVSKASTDLKPVVDQNKIKTSSVSVSEKTVVTNKNIIPADQKKAVTPIKGDAINPGVAPDMKKGIVVPLKKNTPPATNTDAARANAGLTDIFAYVTTGSNDLGNGWGCNKDPDTHWSFGLFDENDNPVASFHDDSNNDEYAPASSVTVKMHIDKQVKFSDFANGGHIHVNIAPNGNDSWCFDQLALTIGFANPNFTIKINLFPGLLSQDHRDVDLYFYYDGQNFILR